MVVSDRILVYGVDRLCMTTVGDGDAGVGVALLILRAHFLVMGDGVPFCPVDG